MLQQNVTGSYDECQATVSPGIQADQTRHVNNAAGSKVRMNRWKVILDICPKQ